MYEHILDYYMHIVNVAEERDTYRYKFLRASAIYLFAMTVYDSRPDVRFPHLDKVEYN